MTDIFTSDQNLVLLIKYEIYFRDKFHIHYQILNFLFIACSLVFDMFLAHLRHWMQNMTTFLILSQCEKKIAYEDITVVLFNTCR